jgi:hypothetical protein
MKERIKEIKQKFKDILIEEGKEDYNDNAIYIKTVGKSYLVLDKTTIKNGVETRVFQTTTDVFKAKRFTFDEAIDDYFASNTNEYTSFRQIYKGLGVFELTYDFGATREVFQEYLELEGERK